MNIITTKEEKELIKINKVALKNLVDIYGELSVEANRIKKQLGILKPKLLANLELKTPFDGKKYQAIRTQTTKVALDTQKVKDKLTLKKLLQIATVSKKAAATMLTTVEITECEGETLIVNGIKIKKL